MSGPELALIGGAYKWPPSVMRELTDAEADYYLQHMREVYMRDVYPLAQLEATLRNMMGGKRPKKTRDGEDSEPPLQPHELYSPFELLPWFARPEWVEDSGGASINREAARDFLANLKRVPAWALEIAPLHAIKHAAQA